MAKRYIRTSYTGCPYITAGKLYVVLDSPLSDDDESFHIINDSNNEMFTMRVGSSHLYNIGEWEIVDVAEEEQLEFDFT